MKPACALHRKAQASPNSSGRPKRFAGNEFGDPAPRLIAVDAKVAHHALGHEFLAVGIDALRQQIVEGDIVGGSLDRDRLAGSG